MGAGCWGAAVPPEILNETPNMPKTIIKCPEKSSYFDVRTFLVSFQSLFCLSVDKQHPHFEVYLMYMTFYTLFNACVPPSRRGVPPLPLCSFEH